MFRPIAVILYGNWGTENNTVSNPKSGGHVPLVSAPVFAPPCRRINSYITHTNTHIQHRY